MVSPDYKCTFGKSLFLFQLNCLNRIFFARRYNGDPRLIPINPTVDFEFPPRRRCSFVCDIKERYKFTTESHTCNRKGKHSVGTHSVGKWLQVKRPSTDDSVTVLPQYPIGM